MKALTRALLVVAIVVLAGCAASESASPDLVGPYPAVTAVIRADADGGRLDLLGVRVSAVDLRASATKLATDLFGAENVGEATPTDADTGATPDTLLSTSVPVSIPTEGMQLAVDEATVDAALGPLGPRSSSLWGCSDRRTMQIATQAPGAVSSDLGSGVCQIVGSSIADDGIDWTATLAIGPVTRPSLVPASVGGIALLLVIAGIVAFVWRRRASRRGDVPPSDRPPVH